MEPLVEEGWCLRRSTLVATALDRGGRHHVGKGLVLPWANEVIPAHCEFDTLMLQPRLAPILERRWPPQRWTAIRSSWMGLVVSWRVEASAGMVTSDRP